VDDPIPVTQQLNFYVPAGRHVALEVDARVAERGPGLGHGQREGLGELAWCRHRPQAAAATAGRRLDQYRPADRGCQFRGSLAGCAWLAADLAARHHWQAGRDGVRPGSHLVADGRELPRSRPDEYDARRGAGGREPRVLRQEAVTRVDRVGAGGHRSGDDRVDAEVALPRRGRAEPDNRVGETRRRAVEVGV
jgi:hypothetical protein